VAIGISYTFSVHLPLQQGDAPTVAVLRHEPGRLLVVRIAEPEGRGFHGQVMGLVVRLARDIAAIDRVPHISARLLFSGLAFGAAELAELLTGRWPAESYAVVTLGQGASKPRLDTSEDGLGGDLPFNRFSVPRGALIQALNLAYNQPGKLTVALDADEVRLLREQMNVFSERANRQPANDPDAVMEYAGEGRVVSLGVGVWHAFKSAEAMRQWQQERLAG
jgi:hypothetical protein